MTFALITEGVSEHRIVKHIISRIFKDVDDLEVNQIQPKIKNNKQENTGGWNEVLKYCKSEEIKDILIENDFLIIQIDTDQSETKPFDIKHHDDSNNLKDQATLHQNVVEKLDGLILEEIKDIYSENILFAISIHTIECWLLPIYLNNKKKKKIHRCIEELNTALRKNNIKTIPKSNKNTQNSVKTYIEILKNWKKEKRIIADSKFNFGFEKFVDSLLEIKEQNSSID